MESAVDEIRDKLRAVRDACVYETKEIKQRLVEIEKELEQVDAALTAIGDKPRRKKPGGGKPGKPRKPCADKEQVLALMHETLADNRVIRQGELKDLCAAKLRERGYSLSMFAALFAKCLDDPSICSHGGQPEFVYRTDDEGAGLIEPDFE